MILVTGAGGTVGGELVKRLSAERIAFRAAFHSAAKIASARARGIDAVAADFARPETLGPALGGADALFLVAGSGPDQARLELNAVREARTAGVKRLVKLSVWGAETESFSFAKIHRTVEREIESSDMAWTFLRSNGFMQNLANHFGSTIRSQGAFHLSGGEARISHIDVRDIAAVAAKVLTTAGHEGRAYDLSGPEALTYPRIAERISAALGRRITYVDLPPADLRKGMIESGSPAWYADALLDLLRYYAAGHASRVTPAVRQITGEEPIPFDRFVVDHIEAFK